MKHTLSGAALFVSAAAAFAGGPLASVEHVLMVSIDGMHQQDLARCISANTCPNIAKLAAHGVNYTQAYTPGLSDSVPGLAALVTGGSPRSTGLFYDDIYDRTLYAGTDTQCTGKQGVEVFLQELVGIDALNGGALSHLDGGGNFNPQQIPRRKVGQDCVPVYPHDFIRTNTIFEVVKRHIRGSHTAWSDKHAWGTDWVNGPSGKGVDDMARTEINSLDGPAGNDYTGSYDGIAPAYLHTEVFDNIHVQNILNQIGGKDSTGAKAAPVPTVFGTNFQTLSVAQKALNAKGGGYADAAFTPNPFVKDAIGFVDAAIGKFTAALAARNLANSTLIVLSAKHGQSPADYSQLRKIGHAVSNALGSYVGGGSDPVTGNNLGNGQVTDDDVAFVWLNDQSQREAALNLLRAATACPAVNPTTKIVPAASSLICADNGGSVVDLSQAPMKFGNPADGRTPDIMVQPNPGVIYSTSGAKDMEHGGFAPDDGHVALLVSHPALHSMTTVAERVQTTQVAPTILRALGLNPRHLEAVRVEGTRVLPRLFAGDSDD